MNSSSTMRTFNSFGQFGNFLAARIPQVPQHLTDALHDILLYIQWNAYSKIGHYQGRSGGFVAWKMLSPVTEAEKAKLGFPTGSPLLRANPMWPLFGIDIQGHGLVGYVGSPSPVLLWQELGVHYADGRILPPRPVIGPAAYEAIPYMKQRLGAAAVGAITWSRNPLHTGRYR